MTFRTPGIYREFFARHLAAVRAEHAAYEAEVDEWYFTGDGRPTSEGGRGHAFPYCIHGASLWVSHDIPCGWCEMGLTEIQVAQGRARAHFERFNDRIDWVLSMPDDLPRELRTQLSAWAGELLPNKIGA